jgi:LuxR family transcriptional regulator, maltose regulon positive regulatory protein
MSAGRYASAVPPAGGNPGLIDRPRLIAKLHQAAGHKLTLISAPPGYGKTTLANQFMHEAPLPVAWHAVDASQRNLPLLHQRALSALEPLVPGINATHTPYGFPAEELALQVAEYLRTGVTGELIYIMDDVHHLSGSLAAETWLRVLVEQLPPNCHIIMCSRTLPELPLVEMIAHREVLAIGLEELKFRPDEIYDLALQVRGEPPLASQVESWALRLEGWPAGTVLAIHPLPAELERVMLRGGSGPEALFQDLASSLLEAQPEKLRNFLLQTSTLRRLTPDICAEALGLPGSDALIEALNRNMFLSRVTGGLAYHTLFRDFLQARLQAENPQLFRHLHQQAAAWFAQHNEVIEAVDHYLDADAIPQATQLIERVAPQFFAQGQTQTLLEWAEMLESVWPTMPELLLTCGKVHIDRYEYAEADTKLTVSQRGFRQRDDRHGQYTVMAQHAWLHLQIGAHEQAIELAEQILDESDLVLRLRGLALMTIGVAHLKIGNINEAAQYLEAALPIFREDQDAYTLSNVLQNLEVTYSQLGHMDEAGACLQEVVALRRKLGGAAALALALNNLGVYYHEHSNYQKALETFQEGLGAIARVANRRVESYLLWSMADLQRDRGAFHEAEQLYAQALDQLEDDEPALRVEILIGFARLRRWQNRPRETQNLAIDAVGLAESHNLNLLRIAAQVEMVATRTQSDELNSALTRIDGLVADIRNAQAQIELVHALVVRAHLAGLHGRQTQAITDLNEAVQICETLGTAQPLAAQITHTPKLNMLVKTQQSSCLANDLQILQNNLYKSPAPVTPVISADLNADTFRLQVHTLGQETIDRDGRKLTTTEWRANTARELFLYLLFCGPISRERINLEFWPDISAEKARYRFHTTLYRARQAVGEKAIVFDDELYFVNPETEVWCDAHEMEKLATQARLLSPRDPRAEDLWRKAVSLYQGDFLGTIDAEWVMSRREMYGEIYLEALAGVGACARARGDISEALNAFRRALDADPYREDINRAIMTCYADLGDKHQVVTHYRRLRERLWQDLAAEPSAETVALANRLLA